jgi:hypothetical protein
VRGCVQDGGAGCDEVGKEFGLDGFGFCAHITLGRLSDAHALYGLVDRRAVYRPLALSPMVYRRAGMRMKPVLFANPARAGLMAQAPVGLRFLVLP